MEHDEEILDLAAKLRSAASASETAAFREPLAKLRQAADAVGRSWSESWLGYQANVYYADLRRPPPGAHFSSEWGLEELFSGMGTRGDWREFDPQEIRAHIRELAGNPDLAQARKIAGDSIKQFEAAKSEALSILELELNQSNDPYVERLKGELERMKRLSVSSVTAAMRPQGQVFSRDMLAFGQGFRTPPHLIEIAEVVTLEHNASLCGKGEDLFTKIGSHLERRRRKLVRAARVGTNVFIGHGRAGAWRELKDFVQERIGLPWDEFNRVPVAGVTNIARLSEMLDSACVAFLVLTGEDEMADGALQARMNVIHEAGLFQGRLGFSKAIVLLEEGCSEFSNIQGLGHIRFPRAQISAAFESVRQVLEREGLVEAQREG